MAKKTNKPTAKRGRPSSYDPKLADEICARIALGEPLAVICKEDKFPHAGTIFATWLNREDFHEAYARARRSSADKLADEIVQISDDPKLDPNDKRVRVDARKWVAAKLKPQSYGDKLDLNLSGEVSVKTIPDDKLDEKLDALLEKLK